MVEKGRKNKITVHCRQEKKTGMKLSYKVSD